MILSLHSLDPFLGLTLRINNQRPSRSRCNNNPIFCAEIIGWQTLNVPLPDRGWITQKLDHVEVVGRWDLQCDHLNIVLCVIDGGFRAICMDLHISAT